MSSASSSSSRSSLASTATGAWAPSSAASAASEGLPRVVFIEGNIGSGKSTLCAHLSREAKRTRPALRVRTVEEPLGEWVAPRTGGKSALQLFYQDPGRWAFTLQALIAHTRDHTLRAEVRRATADGIDVLVFERSSLSDDIFLPMLREAGHLTGAEAELLGLMGSAQRDFCRGLNPWIVYLRESPATCLARVEGRARPGEAGGGSRLDLGYLERLHLRHDRLLMEDGAGGRLLSVCGGAGATPEASASAVLTALRLAGKGPPPVSPRARTPPP